jgi:hypothetical protein
VNHYHLRDNRYIIGKDVLDAIKNNIKCLSTESNWNPETQKSEKIVHPADEVFAEWRPDILGGKGGVEVVMRGNGETFSEWVHCDKEEWPHGCIEIETHHASLKDENIKLSEED